MRRRFACVFIVAFSVISSAQLVAEEGGVQSKTDLSDKASQKADEGFDQAHRFLKRYCTSCHNSKRKKAGLDLTPLSSRESVTQQRKTWSKILHMVREREMPPEDKRQPKDDERSQFDTWVSAELDSFDCSDDVDPGKVTIRRLNRAEYDATVQDLLSVEFSPASDFPADDSGYGFDNIGDVLSLPPLLIEKYLEAAEQLSEAALGKGLPSFSKRVEAETIRGVPSANRTDGDTALMIGREAEANASFQVSRDGWYLIRARAYGHQAGSEAPKMAVRLAGEDLEVFDVKAIDKRPIVYDRAVYLKAGKHRIGVAYLNNYKNFDHPDPSLRGDRNLIVDYIQLQLLLSGRPRSASAYFQILGKIDLKKDRYVSVLRRRLTKLAERAYRRPVADDEAQRLVELARSIIDEGGTIEEAVQIALQAILVSPHFLFRVELDEQGRGLEEIAGSAKLERSPISDYALASRLSYFLWSSLPDDELAGLAKQGKLNNSEVLEAQVRRMLADEKSKRFVDNFAGQWLQTRFLRSVSPDPKLFPGVDEAMRGDMATETLMFFDAIVHEDRSVLEIIDADFTFVNERLAEHYGLEGVRGDAFQRVSLADNPRGGLLTQASFLTLTSNPTRTSPVKRGLWVLDRLLGTPPPPPPPDVPELEEGEAIDSGSLRERLEKHRENATCASCHDRFDPIGFAFENFDAVGKWREFDGEFLIEPGGVLPDGSKFSGPEELRKVLLGKKDLYLNCLAEKILTYALGRGLEYYDQCAVDQMVERLKANDYRFSSLVLAVVESEPFRLRRGARKE